MSLEERLKRASPQRRAEELFRIEQDAIQEAKVTQATPAAIPFSQYLSRLDDYVAYFELHPEWHGKTTIGFREDVVSNRFRVALYKKVSSSRLSSQRKKEFLDSFFVRREHTSKWARLHTIDDCKKFLEEYPSAKEYGSKDADALRGRMGQMRRAGLIELSQLNQFIRDTYGPQARPAKMGYDEYKARVDAHPEWRGLPRSKLMKIPLAWATYAHSLAWLRDNVPSRKKRKEMRIELFGPLNPHPTKYPVTLEGWKSFIPEQPAYITSSFADVKKDKAAFRLYAEFSRWLQENIPDKSLRSKERNAFYSFAKVFPKNP